MKTKWNGKEAFCDKCEEWNGACGSDRECTLIELFSEEIIAERERAKPLVEYAKLHIADECEGCTLVHCGGCVAEKKKTALKTYEEGCK